MTLIQQIITDTLNHERALRGRLEDLMVERKEVKRTLRALTRYRKQLGAPPPGLPGLAEPERPLIDAIEAAGNGQPEESIDDVNEKLWQAAEEFGRGMAEPYDGLPSVDERIGDDAPEVTEEATPKRRKRSKAE